MMLSSFSCASWPSVCLLWRNVYLDLPPMFWLGCLFVCFVLSSLSFLYILEINALLVISFTNIFSQSVGCLFVCLFMVSFAVQQLISLIMSHLVIFAFIYITLGDRSKKIFLRFMSKSNLPIFSSRSFMVSGLTFRSLIHFEFIFVYDLRECSNFILLYVVIQLSLHHLLKRVSEWEPCWVVYSWL